jgi:FkbH-like protein
MIGPAGQRQLMATALDAVTSRVDRLVVVHSSMVDLGLTARRAAWDALHAVDGLVARGLTLVVPTYTFSFCSGGEYDEIRTPGEVGVLGNLFLRQHEVRRTDHPIYSHAVKGPLAEDLCACANSTTFGADSAFAFFREHDALIVMLGCDWKYATPFHHFEEIHAVPYRYFKDFTGPCVRKGIQREISARMFVRDLEVDAHNDFSPLVEALNASDKIRRHELGPGTVQAARMHDIAAVADEQLRRDPWCYVGNRSQARQRLQARVDEPLRVAVLGSSNLEILLDHLRQCATELLPGRRLECVSVPFGQLFESILDPASPLMTAEAADVHVFVDQLEDLIAHTLLEAVDRTRVLERVDQYVAAIARYRAARGGLIMVHRFARLRPPTGHMADDSMSTGIASLVDEANRHLSDGIGGMSECVLCDPLRMVGAGPARDTRMWLLGRIPYGAEFSRAIARDILRAVLSYAGLSARVIAVDLDNTLWGGILGEDGPAGLSLGGDFPGNAYALVQQILAQMKEHGVALAICSKNDDDLAVSAIDSLPGMVLRSGDFVARRINWEPKWSNIVDIAEEVGIGLANILLIDDNPVEREAVRQHLPDVKVLDLPDDPAAYADAILDCPWLSFHDITESDRSRVASYGRRSDVMAAKARFDDVHSFVAGLELVITLQALSPDNLSRTLQLFRKTNQFNTTTRRHTESDLQEIQASGGLVVVLAIEDRFNSRENMGALVLRDRPDHPGALWIESYLLSCRALGKGVETAVVEHVLSWALSAGYKEVYGEVVSTERNAPARRVYADLGFSDEGNGWWRSEAPPRLADQPLTIRDEVLVDRVGLRGRRGS